MANKQIFVNGRYKNIRDGRKGAKRSGRPRKDRVKKMFRLYLDPEIISTIQEKALDAGFIHPNGDPNPSPYMNEWFKSQGFWKKPLDLRNLE